MPQDWFARQALLEGVPSAVAAARDGVDALLQDRGLRRTTPELTAESLLRGAAASAELEGSESTLEDLRDGGGDLLAMGAARLSAELLSLVPVITRSPLQALARMHTLAATGLVEPDLLGRPSAGEGVAGQLQQLSQRLVAPTEAPAVAVATIAHAEMATLVPFEGANGLVARGLERLILVSRGVDPTSMTVPEAGHLSMSAGYRAGLEAYASGSWEGRRTWLTHATSAVAAGATMSPLH
ncbi:MAG: oxidoreductase [Nocardioidaceae bacterium]